MNKRIIDLTGKKIGRLTVIRLYDKTKWGYRWLCSCECDPSKEVIALGSNLRRPNHTTSCGCRQADITRERSTIHGEAPRTGRSKEYWAVHNAEARCENPNNPHYDLYHGKGRYVCPGVKDVLHLISIIGRCPPEKDSLGRIHNPGSYTCGDCPQCKQRGAPMNLRWETHKEQMNNTVNSLTFDGKTIAELATEQGKDIGQLRTELGLKNYDAA